MEQPEPRGMEYKWYFSFWNFYGMQNCEQFPSIAGHGRIMLITSTLIFMSLEVSHQLPVHNDENILNIANGMGKKNIFYCMQTECNFFINWILINTLPLVK
jgi:hypothetical protein